MKLTKKIISYFVLILFLILLFLTIYINSSFNNAKFELLLYNLMNSEGTSIDTIISGSIFIFFGIVLTLIILFVIKRILNRTKTHVYLTFIIKNKSIKLDVFKLSEKKKIALLIFFAIFTFITTVRVLGIDEYIYNQIVTTKIFEENYVDASKVDFVFPKKKQNLIYIYVESLETTNVSIENGGGYATSYIPNLEELALQYTNFSNTNKLGGAQTIYGTDWTAAAMMSQTAGIPLKISIDYNSYSGYGSSVPGVYSLGEILLDNGYQNYLMMGSDATFGGRRDYFSFHGDYTMFDYLYAIKENWIDENYSVWWGYEDSKLYEFAKKQLLDISKQDFYKDTTIIITGDHLTMQSSFYNDIEVEDYKRNIYNVFINSRVTTENNKNRIFSSFDMFPTTLAALGVEIPGDKLGLGTNLFSSEKTIEEIYGIDYLDKELSKKSKFYDNNILGDTYYKMLKS